MQYSQASRKVRAKQPAISSRQSEDLSLLSDNERVEFENEVLRVEETVIKKMVRKRQTHLRAAKGGTSNQSMD